jgi:hypothetical protein
MRRTSIVVNLRVVVFHEGFSQRENNLSRVDNYRDLAMDKPLLNNRFDRIRISGVTLNICYFLFFSGCPNGHPYVIGDVSLYINSHLI